jgi:hypothetical protein
MARRAAVLACALVLVGSAGLAAHALGIPSRSSDSDAAGPALTAPPVATTSPAPTPLPTTDAGATPAATPAATPPATPAATATATPVATPTAKPTPDSGTKPTGKPIGKAAASPAGTSGGKAIGELRVCGTGAVTDVYVDRGTLHKQKLGLADGTCRTFRLPQGQYAVTVVGHCAGNQDAHLSGLAVDPTDRTLYQNGSVAGARVTRDSTTTWTATWECTGAPTTGTPFNP